MADNRMNLRCRGCGATMMLGKMFLSSREYYFTKSDEEKGRELADFMADHAHCCDEKFDDAFSPDFHPFELEYEND